MAKIRKLKEQKAKEDKEDLLIAAAKVIGRHGYANASIERITKEAGIAQGTFYLNFESRQSLFDQLLPYIATKALDHLRERTPDHANFFDREENAFRVFFNYILTHPYYYRVLGEAETAAPVAFENWFSYIIDRYVHSLAEALQRKEISGLTKRELRFMAVILLACRRYVYQHFVKSELGPGPLPEWVVQAYMKMIRRCLSEQNIDQPERVSRGAPRKQKSRSEPISF